MKFSIFFLVLLISIVTVRSRGTGCFTSASGSNSSGGSGGGAASFSGSSGTDGGGSGGGGDPGAGGQGSAASPGRPASPGSQRMGRRVSRTGSDPWPSGPSGSPGSGMRPGSSGRRGGRQNNPGDRNSPTNGQPSSSSRDMSYRLASLGDEIAGPVQKSFSCDGKEYGYYADIANECKVYHVCVPEQKQHYSFFCNEGTIFNQEDQTCVRKSSGSKCTSGNRRQ